MERKTRIAERARLRRAFARCEGFGARSFSEAAQLLCVSEATIRAWIKSGRLLTVRVRGEKMVPNSELRRQLSN